MVYIQKWAYIYLTSAFYIANPLTQFTVEPARLSGQHGPVLTTLFFSVCYGYLDVL